MVNLTLAIGDFMLMLTTAALWSAAGIVGIVLLGAGALGGVAMLWRRRH